MLRLRHVHQLLPRSSSRVRAFLANAGGRGGDDGKPKPMTYNFGGVEPDLKAACLSEKSKQTIWQTYRDNPLSTTVDKLAAEFRVSKQRVHAILWLKEAEKAQEAKGGPLSDELEQEFAELHGSYDVADGERYATVRGDQWAAAASAGSGDSGDTQEQSVILSKGEQMLLLEFEQRMEFNKKIVRSSTLGSFCATNVATLADRVSQISGVIKTDPLSRQRPSEGWSYVVEELGSEGKRGKRGGKRFISLPNGTHRQLNDLEKEFLKRETLRPRRRITPR